MRRVIAVAAIAITALALAAAPAAAVRGQTTHVRFHGAYAEALWGVATSDSQVQSEVTASLSSLLVVQSTAYFDPDGTFTGATMVSAEVNDGFTFSIDTVKLATASVSADGLPGQACTFDANGDLVGCSDVSIGLSVTWTGRGLIGTETTNERFRSCQVSYGYHSHGKSRDAVAAGTVEGVAFTSGDVMFSNLGTTHSGETYFRISNHC